MILYLFYHRKLQVDIYFFLMWPQFCIKPGNNKNKRGMTKINLFLIYNWIFDVDSGLNQYHCAAQVIEIHKEKSHLCFFFSMLTLNLKTGTTDLMF